jgi:hypothetical protein
VAESVQHRVLEALESARNYNDWIASLVFPYLGADPIEIGSGTGTFAGLWLTKGVPRITVSETDGAMVVRLRERFHGDPRVAVEQLDVLESGSGEHSALVAINVLEHIADDVQALRSGTQLIRRGGAVVLFVPAHQVAMSRFDRAIGHYRRYTAASLRERCVEAGIAVDELKYVNAPGLFAWILGMRLLRMTPTDGALLHGWDRTVVPMARWIEARASPPFGQSLLAVGHSAA